MHSTEAGVDRLQALGVAGNVAGEEGEELSEHGVISLGVIGAGEKYRAIRLDHIVNLVTFAELEDAAYGFGNRGLVAVGEGGFDFEGGRHDVYRVREADAQW